MDNNFDRKVQLMNSLNTQKDIYYFRIVSFVLELQLDFLFQYLRTSYMFLHVNVQYVELNELATKTGEST